MSVEERVAAHYRNNTLLAAIRNGLKALGKDTENLTVQDLEPVDHYHGGGVDSTRSIVTLTKNWPNLLLDHEAKSLKMSISTIGESPRFRCESD